MKKSLSLLSDQAKHLFFLLLLSEVDIVFFIYFLPLLLSSRRVNYLPCSNYSINCTFFLWARDAIINVGSSGDLTFPNENINFTMLYSVIEGVDVYLSIEFFWLVSRWHNHGHSHNLPVHQLLSATHGTDNHSLQQCQLMFQWLGQKMLDLQCEV